MDVYLPSWQRVQAVLKQLDAAKVAWTVFASERFASPSFNQHTFIIYIKLSIFTKSNLVIEKYLNMIHKEINQAWTDHEKTLTFHLKKSRI